MSHNCSTLVVLRLASFGAFLLLALADADSSPPKWTRLAPSTTTHIHDDVDHHHKNTALLGGSRRRVRLLAFASCAAPRFDTFAEQLLSGSWGITNTRVESTQEVMRSCGGAVQGIRDIPYILQHDDDDHEPQKEPQEGPYHNRANDGFIYFDCGSYSSYKTDVSSAEEEKDDSIILTSVTLPAVMTRTAQRDDAADSTTTTTHKSRVILSGTWMMHDKDDDDTSWRIQPQIMARVYRVPPSFSSSEDHLGLEDTDYQVDRVEDIPSNVVWTKQQICFMPSPNQPWMLQRVKWDRCFVGGEEETQNAEEDVLPQPKDNNNNDDDDNVLYSSSSTEREEVSSVLAQNNTVAWAVTKTMDAESIVSNNHNHNMFLNNANYPTIPDNGSVQVISMGAACRTSRAVRALVRTYSQDGMLLHVILQEGSLQ